MRFIKDLVKEFGGLDPYELDPISQGYDTVDVEVVVYDVSAIIRTSITAWQQWLQYCEENSRICRECGSYNADPVIRMCMRCLDEIVGGFQDLDSEEEELISF